MTSPNAAPPAHAPNAALLIDFDNVTMGIRSDLQGELNNLLSSDIVKGKVAVRRAYADWRRYPQYIVPLTESSIDLIFAPAYGSSKKNATDIRLAIDAMELVFTRPEIGTFVLLSGDSDFSSMVIKLKEYGKYVIGVGIRESSSDLLVMNCDEYYSYNALAGLTKTGDDESTRWDPWELVTESVNRMKRNGDVMRSDRLKQVMQEIDSSFDEKNLGMPKFSRFVQDAAHKGLLKVTKLDSGQLEIDTPDGSIAPASSASAAAPAEPRREESDRERDERRGRRGRRGRGRERFDRTPVEGEVRDAVQDAAEDLSRGLEQGGATAQQRYAALGQLATAPWLRALRWGGRAVPWTGCGVGVWCATLSDNGAGGTMVLAVRGEALVAIVGARARGSLDGLDARLRAAAADSVAVAVAGPESAVVTMRGEGAAAGGAQARGAYETALTEADGVTVTGRVLLPWWVLETVRGAVAAGIR